MSLFNGHTVVFVIVAFDIRSRDPDALVQAGTDGCTDLNTGGGEDVAAPRVVASVGH
jgi:hypothetical protein